MDARARERLSSCYAPLNPAVSARSRPMKTEKQGTATRAKSSGVGFLLLDASFEPIYANDDAIQILTYPKGGRKLRSLNGVLGKKIESLLFDGHTAPQFSPPTAFLSGRRQYHCRTFPVESNSTNLSDATAVLFERGPRESIDVAQISAEFHLTDREQETVEFLIEGLTSKEIAGHMNISPNTVKAFIRLVMVKMGVSTRSGIIGKFVKNHSLRRRGSTLEGNSDGRLHSNLLIKSKLSK